MHSLTSLAADKLCGRHARSKAKAERARLRAELRSYSTPSQRADLDAMLSRHTAEQVAPLEALLR